MNASFKLTYNGKDISESLASYLASLSYTDHASGKADDLQIACDDVAGLWKGSWFPEKGATLAGEITCNGRVLTLGTYSIDEISFAGPPDTVTIKAVSALIGKSLKSEKKTKAWENVTLERIAEDLAAHHGFSLFYEADVVQFDRVGQREESDLAFLQRLCGDNGFNLKVAEEKIIIYSGKRFESKSPVLTLERGDADLKTYAFKTKSHDIYKACKVRYWHPEKKEELSYEFVPEDAPDVGQVLPVNKVAESMADAVTMAQNELRRANKDEITGSFSLAGNPVLLGGLNIAAAGFGVFDGNYFITEASHTLSRMGGYETGISIRKVLSY